MNELLDPINRFWEETKSIQNILDELINVDFESDNFYNLAKFVFDNLSGSAKDTLVALYEKGPLFDGDVPSKQGRDELLEYNLISKAVVKGEQGYQVCNYLGSDIYKYYRDKVKNEQ